MKISFILISIGLLLYSFSLFNGFVWDDEVFLQHGSAISRDAQAMTTGVYFRPVMTAIQNTLYVLFGPQPFFYHLFQVIIHIATAILLYYLLKRFFREGLAFLLSLIFLVHPANVEAVCFASAMQEVLFTFTGILALYILVRSREISLVSIIISTLLSGAALLMKETGVMFFALIGTYLLLYHRKNSRAVQLFVAFSIIIIFTYGMARLEGGNTYVQGGGLFPIMRVPFTTRLINIPMIILYYVGKFFFPFNLAIAQHWVVRSLGFHSFFLPLMVGMALFVLAVVYSLKTKNKVFIFFFLWFLIGLLPHLQIIPLNMTVAERWMYFPMIGLVGMIGAAASFWQGPQGRVQNQKIDSGVVTEFLPRMTIIVASIIFVLFFLRSFVRTLDWRSGLSLYGSTISRTSSFDLQNNMGVELFRIGKYRQAKQYFEVSTRLAPYWWVNWNNLGAAYEREQNYGKAAECYGKSIQNGKYALAYENLAKILVLHGTDQQKTDDFVKNAVNLFPENETLKTIQRYKTMNTK